jgi:hypothetical protein
MTPETGHPHGRHAAVFFLLCFTYVLAITLLRHTPWLAIGPGFASWMGITFAAVPFAIACIAHRPSYYTTALLAACLGPHHRTAILAAFAMGIVLLVRVVIAERGDVAGLCRRAFRQHGAGWFTALGMYCACVWLLRLGDSTDAWSFLALAASLFTVPLAFFALSFLPWSARERTRAAWNAALFLFAVATVILVYPLITGAYEQYTVPFFAFYKAVASFVPLPFAFVWHNPDYNTASLRSAHYSAVILFLLAFALAVYGGMQGRRHAVYALLAFIMFFASSMGENVHAFPGMLLGVVASAVLLVRGVRRPSRASAVVLAVTGAAAVLLIVSLYRWSPYYNFVAKARLYDAAGAMVEDHPGRYLLGEGPAAFASHAAQKRLQAGAGDEFPFPLLPSFGNPRYEAALHRARTDNMYTTLNRPVSGVLGVVMEWGLLGTALLVLALHRILRSALAAGTRAADPIARAAAATAVAAVPLIGLVLVFRPYLEYPDVMCVVCFLFFIPLLASRSHDGTEGTPA